MPLSTAPFCHHVAKPFSTICESTVFIGLCGGVGLTAVAKADSSDWESGLLCLHVSQKGSVPLSRPMLVSESIPLKLVNTPASSADNSTQLQICRSGIWEAGVFAPLLSENNLDDHNILVQRFRTLWSWRQWRDFQQSEIHETSHHAELCQKVERITAQKYLAL